MTYTPFPYIGPEQIAALASPREAVEAVEAALRAGFDPADDPARSHVDVRHGQFLIMPSERADSAGVKIVTVAPHNSGTGLPRIQGLYVLFDAVTLTPKALLDAPALTALRTPAVSMAAVRPVLTRTTEPLNVVVFGAGPQGVGHADTLKSVLYGTREISSVTYVVQRPEAHTALRHADVAVVATGGRHTANVVRDADVVVCATTSRRPVFDSSLVRDDAVVIAVGSHEPDAREVDAGLLRRAQVIVEDVTTALRECGDVVMAIGENAITREHLITMRSVVSGEVELATDRPVLFKSAGMSWQDLVVAEAIVSRLDESR
ncbi:ornithine cyclodeaminase family protein [Planotetraspora phitsanulokensis]|uniref:Delta(1)-pyrroline-2-carboxylate reductase n=1 Tax=Planotetraspora phitsanulokensis TaxID=575192 RepID=A0A8J3U0I4_9ACTN|nr:ornithine cyclodeaminase family protein [Planotetraspora phitsanulokensis]GII35996.1 delta(1)-pyrroline-2-carboxylate reductase [Planotetraspora phitsanulokensis]